MKCKKIISPRNVHNEVCMSRYEPVDTEIMNKTCINITRHTCFLCPCLKNGSHANMLLLYMNELPYSLVLIDRRLNIMDGVM